MFGGHSDVAHLLTGRVCKAIEPAQLVTPHCPEGDACQDVLAQQGLIAGMTQRDLNLLTVLGHMDLAVYATQLLLTVTLQRLGSLRTSKTTRMSVHQVDPSPHKCQLLLTVALQRLCSLQTSKYHRQ